MSRFYSKSITGNVASTVILERVCRTYSQAAGASRAGHSSIFYFCATVELGVEDPTWNIPFNVYERGKCRGSLCRVVPLTCSVSGAISFAFETNTQNMKKRSRF